MAHRIYFIAITVLLFCSISLQDDHSTILKQVAKDFQKIHEANRKQYAVLYIPNKNAQNGKVDYKPNIPHVVPSVVYPGITDTTVKSKSYPSTYSGLTPDYGGKMFRKILGRNTFDNIHTEDLALNLVFPWMRNWFASTSMGTVSRVYLYSYYLPCPDCTNIIQKFFNGNQGVSLYIGFSQLFGGYPNENKNDVKARKSQLQNIVKNKGYLYDLGCNYFNNRRKRDLDEVCALNATIGIFSLKLNFSSGTVLVSIYGFANGTVYLKDVNDNVLKSVDIPVVDNQNKDISFGNIYMTEGHYAVYRAEGMMTIQTEPWKQCGFGWNALLHLPANYEQVSVKLEIVDGSPVVCLRSTNYDVMKHDKVQLEGIDESESAIEISNAQVQQFTVSKSMGSERCYTFSRLNKDFSHGFRAKYLICLLNNTCIYGGIYDNASPIWTPETCYCGDCYHDESNVIGSASKVNYVISSYILMLLVFVFLN